MAVIYERVNNSEDLIRAYSDAGMMIRQDDSGILYSEAIDPDYTNRTYTETDIPIEVEENIEEPLEDDGYLDSQDAIDLIFGGTR